MQAEIVAFSANSAVRKSLKSGSEIGFIQIHLRAQ
jgi:hypothetical protein